MQISCHNNKITVIPAKIENCKNLKKFDYRFNKITVLLIEIAYFKQKFVFDSMPEKFI